MRIPRATYRLQFREGMTFARAATLAPYLRRLGISHLYASPVFKAVTGSTHGYDVADPTELDPELGGEDGFYAMTEALKEDALGLIVDFVPNHMAASVENPWWHDVLRYGRASTFARHFDIDWNAGPLTLPFLGKSFESAVHDGNFSLVPGQAGYTLRYYDTAYPLNEAGVALIDRAGETTGLVQLSQDPEFLNRLHAVQHWRLDDLRNGSDKLTYRRFFEITGLVGLRVEDPAVFDDVHDKLFDLVDLGLIDGVRLDHVDGLADPTAYLRNLRDRLGEDIYIVVEKILEGEESLPPNWPVAGTTGYEFIGALAQLLTTDAETATLDAGYRAFTRTTTGFEVQITKAKHAVISVNLAAERHALVRLAQTACATWLDGPSPPEDLAAAIAAVASHMPVYRTYVDTGGSGPTDQALIYDVARRATAAHLGYQKAIDLIRKLLALDVPAEAKNAALAFTVRFQQTTGAVMAKAVEDTAFYRFNRLIGLNEVGGDPNRLGGGVLAWHPHMIRRSAEQPHGLSATATHDTKRGEDARARLYVISEAPGQWGALVERWSDMVQAPSVDGETKWLLFQALLGVWPPEGEEKNFAFAALADRFADYAVKAVREAKRHTSWTDPDDEFESNVRAFAHALLSSENSNFHADFALSVRPFIRAGAVNSLTQLLLKLMAPGVPDIYQGTEQWDLSLVDPDNRRPPAFTTLAKESARRAMSPAEAMAGWTRGLPKKSLMMRGLEMRATAPGLFAHGTYQPLHVIGPASDHVVAFMRNHGDATVAAIAPRCVFGRVDEAGPLRLERGWLEGTTIDLRLSCPTLRNSLTGETVRTGQVNIGEVLDGMPIGLLSPSNWTLQMP